MQVGSQLCLGAAGMLAHINHRKQGTEVQAKRLQTCGCVGDEIAVKYSGIVSQSLKHQTVNSFS